MLSSLALIVLIGLLLIMLPDVGLGRCERVMFERFDIHTCMCVYIYIYIYIYREIDTHTRLSLSIYIYIYTSIADVMVGPPFSDPPSGDGDYLPEGIHASTNSEAKHYFIVRISRATIEALPRSSNYNIT